MPIAYLRVYRADRLVPGGCYSRRCFYDRASLRFDALACGASQTGLTLGRESESDTFVSTELIV
jgi:hypothetical protein